jgi:hypothetical protein
MISRQDPSGLEWALNPMTDILIRRKKDMKHREERPCTDGSRAWTHGVISQKKSSVAISNWEEGMQWILLQRLQKESILPIL